MLMAGTHRRGDWLDGRLGELSLPKIETATEKSASFFIRERHESHAFRISKRNHGSCQLISTRCCQLLCQPRADELCP